MGEMKRAPTVREISRALAEIANLGATYQMLIRRQCEQVAKLLDMLPASAFDGESQGFVGECTDRWNAYDSMMRRGFDKLDQHAKTPEVIPPPAPRPVPESPIKYASDSRICMMCLRPCMGQKHWGGVLLSPLKGQKYWLHDDCAKRFWEGDTARPQPETYHAYNPDGSRLFPDPPPTPEPKSATDWRKEVADASWNQDIGGEG